MRKIFTHAKGFSLLEILVSVGILAIALVSLMTMHSAAMRASLRAENLSLATMLAKKELAEYSVQISAGLRKGEFPEDKVEEGNFEEPYGDYRWRAEIKTVQLPAPPSAEGIQGIIAQQLTGEISKSVRELILTVFWTEGGEEQRIDVVTHVVKM